MAQLATCPFCTTQLALPDGTTLSDRARCPRCAQEFLLMETVQFSIPTAEILPPQPPEVAASPEPVTLQDFTPEPTARETASDIAASPEGYGFSQESFSREDASEVDRPIPEPLPAASTLSDWEARLKRAMADDVDEVSRTGTVFPTYEPSETSSPQAEETFQPQASHDFAVPEADLVPEKESSSAQTLDEWSPDDYIDEEDLTVKTNGDQTVKDYAGETEETEVSIVAEPAPRQKRKRSMLRTLASAGLGVIGIPIGLHVLLWLRGPAGDVANIAQYLPSFMLPESFDRGVTPVRLAQESPSINEELPLADSEDEAETKARVSPEIREDPEVAPASAEDPMYHGPTFDLVDGNVFAELLTAAEQAAPQLGGGDLKSKESVARKGQAYMALARLADKSSYLNQPKLTPEETTKSLLAKQIFEVTLRDAKVGRDLAQIALRWWQYPERPSSGMILSGRVERLQPTEAGAIAYLSLDTEPVAPEIPVLVGEAVHREGEVIGVVGSIMVDPQKQLSAMGVPADPILIAHYSFPLQPPTSSGTDSRLLQLTQ